MYSGNKNVNVGKCKVQTKTHSVSCIAMLWLLFFWWIIWLCAVCISLSYRCNLFSSYQEEENWVPRTQVSTSPLVAFTKNEENLVISVQYVTHERPSAHNNYYCYNVMQLFCSTPFEQSRSYSFSVLCFSVISCICCSRFDSGIHIKAIVLL